jgi:hypothetical protein
MQWTHTASRFSQRKWSKGIMKLSVSAISVALVAVFAGTVYAQDGLIQPVTVGDSTGYVTYYQDDASAKPADAPVVADSTQKSCGCAKSNCSGCDKGCGRGRGILGRHLDSICTDCEHDCPERDPWRLFGNCNDCNSRGITVEGWLAGGGTASEWDPANGSNGTVFFNDLPNEAMLNQAYVSIGRETDTSECCFDLGFRVDYMFGHDAEFVKGYNLDEDWQSSSQYGSSLPQAYIDLGWGDTNTKVGRYYTIIGYEVVTSPHNFFYSHSLSFFYAEPFTHTGFLTTVNYSDNWTFAFGVDRGWNTWEDPNNDLSVTGGAFWTSCDERTTLAFAGTYGDEFSVGNGENTKRSMGSFVMTREITGKMDYIMQVDTYFQDGKNGNEDEDAVTWNNYLIYQLNCCWSAGTRFEIFSDDDGTLIGNGDATYYELTMGLNWQATDNLKVRPEVRWDWAEGKGGTTVNPYNDGQDDSQVTAAIGVDWLW